MYIIKYYPNFKLKAVTFSFDDGVIQDNEMINMLDEFHLKATFNINSNQMNAGGDFIHPSWLTNRKVCENQVKEWYKNHEVASHTSNHSSLVGKTEEELEFEICHDVERLSKLVGYQVTGFAYPYGIVTPEAIQKIKQAGLLFARTVQSQMNFDLPENWYTYGGSIDMSHPELNELVGEWLQLNPSEMKLFYIWGHSFELDMYHEHEKFYEILKELANKEDTYYDTNSHIVSYIKALDSLIVSENYIHNPTDVDVYIQYYGFKTCLKAHEKRMIKE